MNDNAVKYDILKELFNISAGKAASMLSEITNRKILLNVPDIKIFNADDKKFKLEENLPKVLNGTLMVSSISFEDKLTGRANLIFPAQKMKSFINLCMNGSSIDDQSLNFNDMDFDIVKEIGNIILNSIMGEIGNYLNVNLEYTLPEIKVYSKIDFRKDIENKKSMQILMLYITFIIDDIQIEGAVIVDLTLNSLNILMQKIDEIKDEFYE